MTILEINLTQEQEAIFIQIGGEFWLKQFLDKKSKSKPKSKPLPAEAIKLLGVISDKTIAKMHGLSPSFVGSARALRGIPAVKTHFVWDERSVSLLGTARDADVAFQLGISPMSVKKSRLARGIRRYLGGPKR